MTIAVDLDFAAIRDAARKHGVARLSLFGSAVTNFYHDDSDVDFLVEFLPGREDPFADFCGLQDELKEITHRNVDLIVRRAVRNPYFLETVLSQAEPIYEADF